MTLDLFEHHKNMMENDAEYKNAYEALTCEYIVARALIEARSAAGFTQKDVARKLGITQPAVARIESGKNVYVKTLQRYASAVGQEIRLNIVPTPCA